MMWVFPESAGQPIGCLRTCTRHQDWPWPRPIMTSRPGWPVWRGRTAALRGSSNTTRSRWRAAHTQTHRRYTNYHTEQNTREQKTHCQDVNALFTGESIFSHVLYSPVLQFPMISEFGEERILCCSCEPIIKDTSVIQSETTNLQQRVNSLTQEVLCNISSVAIAEIWGHGITVECRDNILSKSDHQTPS